MANITITNIDTGSVSVGNNQYRDETLTFAGADTFVAGTILGRRAVATALTLGTVQGGTGTGTLTAGTVVHGSIVPMVGIHVLTCIEAVSHGGIFRLVDPNGREEDDYISMMTTTGAAVVIETSGMQFTLTDATDFIVGNYFNITVVADGTLVPFAPTEVGGAQFPIAILTEAKTRASGGTLPIRALISGDVDWDRLVIDATGTVTVAICDQLRSVGITPIKVSQQGKIDNPQ
jgi:hypothetical protein